MSTPDNEYVLPSASPILQSLLECIAGILTVPVFLLLFTRLLIWLKLETRNLLFPGKTTGTQTYQWAALIIRVLLALMLLTLHERLVGGALELCQKEQSNLQGKEQIEGTLIPGMSGHCKGGFRTLFLTQTDLRRQQ